MLPRHKHSSTSFFLTSPHTSLQSTSREANAYDIFLKYLQIYKNFPKFLPPDHFPYINLIFSINVRGTLSN